MLKKLSAVLAAFVLVLVGMLASASPAQAYANCSSSLVCHFKAVNGGGLASFSADGADRPGCFKLTYPNTTRSIDNNRTGTDYNMRVYVNGSGSTGCSGLSTLVYAGTEGNMSGTWYDSIDYIYIY